MAQSVQFDRKLHPHSQPASQPHCHTTLCRHTLSYQQPSTHTHDHTGDRTDCVTSEGTREVRKLDCSSCPHCRLIKLHSSHAVNGYLAAATYLAHPQLASCDNATSWQNTAPLSPLSPSIAPSLGHNKSTSRRSFNLNAISLTALSFTHPASLHSEHNSTALSYLITRPVLDPNLPRLLCLSTSNYGYRCSSHSSRGSRCWARAVYRHGPLSQVREDR